MINKSDLKKNILTSTEIELKEVNFNLEGFNFHYRGGDFFDIYILENSKIIENFDIYFYYTDSDGEYYFLWDETRGFELYSQSGDVGDSYHMGMNRQLEPREIKKDSTDNLKRWKNRTGYLYLFFKNQIENVMAEKDTEKINLIKIIMDKLKQENKEIKNIIDNS